MSKTKKVIISVVMVCLLAATTYLNLSLNNISPTDGDVVTTSNFFTEYRSERASTRDQEMLYLDSIITNTTLSEDTIQTAINQKLTIVDAMETELVLEGLLKAKGFADVAVAMDNELESVNVIVKAEELSQDEVAQIYTVLLGEMEVSQSNVKIIPVV